MQARLRMASPPQHSSLFITKRERHGGNQERRGGASTCTQRLDLCKEACPLALIGDRLAIRYLSRHVTWL